LLQTWLHVELFYVVAGMVTRCKKVSLFDGRLAKAKKFQNLFISLITTAYLRGPCCTSLQNFSI